jgi:Domain of unknown function (DUF4340)
MRSRRRALLITVAALAVGFLLLMAVSGHVRSMQNLVRFEAAGLMPEAPDYIDRVELTAGGQRLVFTRRDPGRWAVGASAGAFPAGGASRLDASLKFMHVTAPIRVLSRGEYEGQPLGEYGLDPPRYTVSLQHGARTVLAMSFGGDNPQHISQYVRVEGRDELYLLPIFVGREWERVAQAVRGS